MAFIYVTIFIIYLIRRVSFPLVSLMHSVLVKKQCLSSSLNARDPYLRPTVDSNRRREIYMLVEKENRP